MYRTPTSTIDIRRTVFASDWIRRKNGSWKT